MVINLYNQKPIPELEIHELGDFYEEFSKLIKYSKILDFSPRVEAWTSSASTKALSYFSHGIFRYFGKFPAPIARFLIKQYTKENDLVIDPMCGSGTSGLEALLLKRRVKCFDINPLSILISRVKVTKLNEDEYLNYLKQVINRVESDKNDSIFDLIGLRDPDHWFLAETRKSLSKIKFAIDDLQAPDNIKDALQVAFLSTVRRVSKATTQQGRLFLDIETAQENALPFFEKKAREIIVSLSLLPINDNQIQVQQESILDINTKCEETAKLIICHPPYFNSYKYSGVNSLELSWYGIDHSLIRKSEVREAFKVGKPEKVVQYVEDMEKALKNLNKYLSPDGRLALMIGDTVIKGEYIPVTKMLIDKISDIYNVEISALRVPKFTEASWVASQRRKSGDVGINLCDLMIILRKK
jgi:site-specific DNA-methyltransferase (cytosine-N4-specific)